MHRRVIWPVVLLAGFALVAATAGSAGAKRPPAQPADVAITDFTVRCVPDADPFVAIEVIATADAMNGSTEIDFMDISLREFRAIEAYAHGYYPYDTTLEVGNWHLSSEVGGLSTATLSMRTDDDDFSQLSEGYKHHFWNTTVNPTGDPDLDSWFEAQAWVDGSTMGKGNRGNWDDRHDQDQASEFLHCVNEPFTPLANPWDHWNWPQEP